MDQVRKAAFSNPLWIVVCGIMAVLMTGAAEAQSRRSDVRQMSCDEARSLVEQAGGIVLTTGQHTYDRYVSARMYCPMGLDIKDAWVATRDSDACRIGYTCVTEPRFPFPGWRD